MCALKKRRRQTWSYSKEEPNIMDLLNKKVTHKAFGAGQIIDCTVNSIEVVFEEGTKKFVYPNAFQQHLVIEDALQSEMAEIVEHQVAIEKEQEAQKEQEAAKQKKMHALKVEHEKLMKNYKMHPAAQMVFDCDAVEQDEVFEEWKVFAGEIKSGKNKGMPSKPTRLHANSAILLTALAPGAKEEERRIIGMYMVKERFIGKTCTDGFIPAHSVYRIELSEEEADQMLFWNYYKDEKNESKIAWKSGKHRYFNNEWMARILKDVVGIQEDAVEQAAAMKFLMHFCRMNQLVMDDLQEAEGALTNKATA